MKHYFNCAISILFLLSCVTMSGCVAAVAPAASSAITLGTGAAAGVMGSGAYNAAQDDKDMEKMGGSANVPSFVCFACNQETAKNAIVEALVESGESIEVATDSFIKTTKKRHTRELGAISSLTGRSEITSTKSITLSKEKGLTKVMVKVDVFRKTMYTDEAKKEWPEVEAKIRSEFFDLLSKKLKTVKS